jgi:hypothetical protein
MRARTRVIVVILLSAIASASGACSTILGLGNYTVGRDAGDAGAAEDARDEVVVDDAAASADAFSEAARDAGCDADASAGCYPCAPTTPTQFVTACTSAMCVPFDDMQRLANLSADGAVPPLPPIPPSEGGTP